MKENHPANFKFIGYISISKTTKELSECDGIKLKEKSSLSNSLQNLIRLIGLIAKPCFHNSSTTFKKLITEFINNNTEENYLNSEKYLFDKIDIEKIVKSNQMCCKLLEEMIYLIAKEEGIEMYEDVFSCNVTPIIDSILLYGCNFCFSTNETQSYARKIVYLNLYNNITNEYKRMNKNSFNTELGPDYIIICSKTIIYLQDFRSKQKEVTITHNTFKYLLFCFYLFRPGIESRIVWCSNMEVFVDEHGDQVSLSSLNDYQIGFIVFTKTISRVQTSSFKIL